MLNSGPRSSLFDGVSVCLSSQSNTRQDLPPVSQSSARCPIQLEGAVRVGNDCPVEGKGFSGAVGRLEIDKAVASVAPAAS